MRRLEALGSGGRLEEAVSALDGLAEMVSRLGGRLEGLSVEQLRHLAAGGGPA